MIGAKNKINICSACNEHVKPAESMTCSICKAELHYLCVGITRTNFLKYNRDLKSAWKCPKCNIGHSRGDNTNTPVRPTVGVNTAATVTDNLPLGTSAQLTAPFIDTAALIAYFDAKFESLRSDWHAQLDGVIERFEHKLFTFETNQTKCDSKITEHEIKLTDLAASATKVSILEEECVMLRSELARTNKNITDMEESYCKREAEMNAKLEFAARKQNDADQFNRQFNVEIQNLPEDKSENLMNIVESLGVALNTPIPNHEIRFIHRTRGGAGVKQPGRPRNIVLQLCTRRLRDDLVAAARVRRGLTTASLQMTGPVQNIYINEHLSITNKILYAKARQARDEKKCEYVWVRNGIVMARRTEGSRPIYIKCEDDLLKL